MAVDVRQKMFSDRCHHSNYLSPIDAAVAICLSLVRTESEESVTIGSFHDLKGEIHVLPFSKDAEISKYEATFTEVTFFSSLMVFLSQFRKELLPSTLECWE